MELEAALRSEVAKVRAALDVAVPARGGWLLRVAAFLRGLVVQMIGLETGEILELNGDGRPATSDGRRQVLADDGRAIALDPADTKKLLVREDGSPARGDVEFGRLGITGFEDESRPRKIGDSLARNGGSAPAPARARVEQGALERSGVNPVLEMVERIMAFRVLETSLETVRLQDAALDRAIDSVIENVSARAPRGTLGPRLLECPGARKGALT